MLRPMAEVGAGWGPDRRRCAATRSSATVGYVPQVRDVFAPLTVKENLEIGGYTLPQREVAARVEEVMGRYPRSPRAGRPAGGLSGGERKMLAIGRVMMRRAEPAGAGRADRRAGPPARGHEFLTRHIASWPARGVAILLVEQHAHEAMAISDRAYVMAGRPGRLSTRPPRSPGAPTWATSSSGGH